MCLTILTILMSKAALFWRQLFLFSFSYFFDVISILENVHLSNMIVAVGLS